MSKFPIDAPKAKVIRTLESLGFRLVREKEHISMVRQNPDGSRTPLGSTFKKTLIKASLQMIISM